MSGSYWRSPSYLDTLEWLVLSLNPRKARLKAKACSMIDDMQWQNLVGLDGQPPCHNETLLGYLERREDAFTCLIAIVSEQGFKEKAAHLREALPPATLPTHQHSASLTSAASTHHSASPEHSKPQLVQDPPQELRQAPPKESPLQLGAEAHLRPDDPLQPEAQRRPPPEYPPDNLKSDAKLGQEETSALKQSRQCTEATVPGDANLDVELLGSSALQQSPQQEQVGTIFSVPEQESGPHPVLESYDPTPAITFPVNKMFLCAKCGRILRSPIQTGCGCVCCMTCIEHLWTSICRTSVDAICPLCGNKMDKNNVFYDVSMERKVMDLEVRCEAAADGCEWIGKMEDLEAHMSRMDGGTAVIQRQLICKRWQTECQNVVIAHVLEQTLYAKLELLGSSALQPAHGGTNIPHTQQPNQLDTQPPPLEGYDPTLAITFPVNKMFLCAKCGRILRSPVQTGCGCHCCITCIGHLWTSKRRICPHCGDKMDKNCVGYDRFMERKVLDLEVRCEAAADGCEWMGKLKDLEVHMSRCQFKTSVCPRYGCTAVIQRQFIHEHWQTECEYRVRCDRCNESIIARHKQQHKEEDCPTLLASGPECSEYPPQSELEGNSNEEARALLCEYRLKSTATGLDVQHGITPEQSQDPAARDFFEPSRHPPEEDLVGTMQSLTVLSTSQTRAGNPWTTEEYQSNRCKLIDRMHPTEMKSACLSLGIISEYEEDEVDEKTERTDKNEEILKVMERYARKFGKFREVLHGIKDFHEIAKDLDAVGPDRHTDAGCLHAKSVLEKSDG